MPGIIIHINGVVFGIVLILMLIDFPISYFRKYKNSGLRKYLLGVMGLPLLTFAGYELIIIGFESNITFSQFSLLGLFNLIFGSLNFSRSLSINFRY